MPRRNNKTAGRALAEWALQGFALAAAAKIAERYNVTIRTMQNWLRALEQDDELSLTFKEHLNGLEKADWVAENAFALTVLIRETLELWRVLRDEATDFDKRLQVLRAAMPMLERLLEPEMIREVLRAESAGENQALSDDAPQHSASQRLN